MNFNTIKSYFLITVGILINSLGWTGFLIPSKIVGGGFSGIGTILYYSLGIPVGVTLAVSNFILIIIAMKIIGAHFGIKTIYGIFLSSATILLFQSLIKEPLVNDAFMATVLGGFLAGAGVGIYFYQGASSGGTDLIALIITKFQDIAPGRILFILDLIIIGSSYFVFQSLETIIYGFVAMAVAAYSVDMVIEGRKQSAQIFIISEEYDKISERLGKELRRGVTILNGKGWYTNKDKNIVMVIVRKNEIPWVLGIVHETDEKAFTSISNAMGVYGEGFETMKRKKKRGKK